MAIIIHYVPEFNFFWAEAGREHKDQLKAAGFNWCDLSYGPKWCPPKESKIDKRWWTKYPTNAYKLKDYLDPAAAQAINTWIESGGAEKDIKESEASIAIHYVPETRVFWADAGRKYASTLKEAGFRWHDVEWSEHKPTCKACTLQVPSKKWYTDNIDIAARMENFADAGAKEAINKYTNVIIESRAAVSDIEVPLPEGRKPYEYQKAGIAWFLSRDNSLMADEMGLGKSLMSLSVVNIDKSIKTVIIFCLASLRINWKKEVDKWLIRKNRTTVIKHVEDIPKRQPGDDDLVSILIIGFPSVRGEYGKPLFDKLMTYKYDLVIIDESHNLKDPKAQQTRSILGWLDLKAKPPVENPGIVHGARKKIYLSGTPVKNRPIEGWTVFHSLAPKIFNDYIKYAFRYCAAYWEDVPQRGGGTIRTLNVKGDSNKEELQRILRSSIMIRRLKEDVLTELPPKTRELILLEPDEKVRKLIEEEKKHVSKDVDELLNKLDKSKSEEEYKNTANQLKEFKARFEEMSRIRHEMAVAKTDAVIEHVKSMIEGMEEGKEKILVFAHHRDVIEKINKELAEYNPVMLYGGMSDTKKNESVERFQTDPNVKVFIGGIDAAGTGLTLTAANIVVFAELAWSPSQIIQAEDRAHRVGQKRNVLIQHLVFDGSMDAKIVKTLLAKMEVISAIVDIKIEVEKVKPEDLPKVEPPITPEEIKKIPVPTVIRTEFKPGEIDITGIPTGKAEPKKEPTEPGQGRVIVEITYTDEQKQAALEGLQELASVCDYALSKDMMGFSKNTTTDGHQLASKSELSDRDMPRTLEILNTHRSQMPDWIRDILGLWPKKEKAIYTPKQKKALYVVAKLIHESPDKDEIFNEDELKQIQEIAETNTTEKGDKTFSDKLLFVFRNLLSEHWSDIDENAIALLESVGIKKAVKRVRGGKVETDISGEEELASETISGEEPKEKEPELVFTAITKDDKYKIIVYKEPNNTYTITELTDNKEIGKTIGNNKQDTIDAVRNRIMYSTRFENRIYSIKLDNIEIGDMSAFTKQEKIDFVELGKQAYNKGIKRAPALDPELDKAIKSLSHNESIMAMKDWVKGWDQTNLAAPVTKIPEIKEEPNILLHIRTDDGSHEVKLTQGKEKNEVTFYFKMLEKEFTQTYKEQDLNNLAKLYNTQIEKAKEKGIIYKILIDNIGVTSSVEVKPHLVFEASTKGNKYIIRGFYNPVDELYTVKDYTGEKEVSTATGIKKEEIKSHLIQKIVNAAKIDNINYIIKGDNIGIDQKEIKRLIEQPIKPVVFPEPEPPKVIISPPEPKYAPETPKVIAKYSEPQKGGIYSIVVYFSTLPKSKIKKEFSSAEQKVFDKLDDDLNKGNSWDVLNDEQINELKHLIEKHASLIPKEYMSYLNATGVRLGAASAATQIPQQPTQRYTSQQKELASMSIAMLKTYFDNMSKKEKAQYTKEWIDNIDRMTQFAQPILDEQVNQIIAVIKKHRRLFDEMGVFEKLGVKFVGRPPKK